VTVLAIYDVDPAIAGLPTSVEARDDVLLTGFVWLVEVVVVLVLVLVLLVLVLVVSLRIPRCWCRNAFLSARLGFAGLDQAECTHRVEPGRASEHPGRWARSKPIGLRWGRPTRPMRPP